MKLIITLAIISVVMMVCSSHPMDMRKKKDGNEKAMPLNTDRNSHAEKRAKEVLMFGNQQNSPRVKKSDLKQPDNEVLLTGLNSDEDSKEHRLTGDPDDDLSKADKSSSPSSSSSSSSSSEELRNETDDVDENKTEEEVERKPDGLLTEDHLREHNNDDDDDDSNSNDDDSVPDSGSHDHGNDDDDDDDNDENDDDDDDDMQDDDMEQELVNNDSDDDQDDDEDNNKYRASKKSSDLPLFPEDSVDADDKASKLKSYALTEELPLLKPEEEMISERELPELVKAGLQPSEQNSYEHLMQEYGNAEPIDVQRERSFQENPLLNYIYRRRRELQDRSPRTKRGLYLPEDSQQYMQAEMPEKLVSLDSWPNAYTQSELLEKEAPYQIDNSELESSYGYDKRLEADFERENERESSRDGIDEDSITDENKEEDTNMPYEEVVLNGQAGYFIPAKRVFFPYSEEPRSHYSGLVGNKRSEPDDDVDYSRLLELARALAVQKDGNPVAKDEDSFTEK